jgi:alpha-L-rhamnosidase
MVDSSVVQSAPSATFLRTEYRPNPLGLDTARPRLSWQLSDDRRGAHQTAYQVTAAASVEALRSGNGLLWDSGKVGSDQSVHVDYAGPALTSRQRVYWAVRLWDHLGNPTAWSEPAFWEMGLLAREDWKAQWIGSALVGGPHTPVPCPLLRKEFAVEGKPVSARLYVTSLGLNDCRINGQRVGDVVFSPGWTHYGKRVQYEVYDVTALLRPGANALAAVLGDGWYCGHVAGQGRQVYGDRPKLLAQLEIRDARGNTQIIATDGSWRWNAGPWLESDLLMGESYDARLEHPGWYDVGFDDSSWSAVQLFPNPATAVVARKNPPVRRIEEIKPVAKPVPHGAFPGSLRWVYDLGQNFAGRVRLKLRGAAGRTVRLRFAEMLQANGSLYTANLRSARATDYYTCRGDGVEVYEPLFTFHGFRYVEVSGLEGQPSPEVLPDDIAPPPADTIVGIVLHSDMPETGSFACSHPLVNQLQSNIRWGQKSNFLEVPTDCPQRDERLGWSGDAQVFARTSAFNMEVVSFFTKWQDDIADEQGPRGEFSMISPRGNDVLTVDGGPAWADAGILCAWTMYLCYGDARLLERHYDSFARFIGFLKETSRDYVRTHEGYEGFHGFGDWLAIDAVHNPGEAPTPKPLIGTAYFAHCTRIMSRIAALLGKDADAEKYRQLDGQVRAAFVREFVTDSGRIVGNSQTAFLLALAFDLVPPEQQPMVLKLLLHDIVKKRKNRLTTGFVGTPLLAPVLSRFGRHDVAYKLLEQEEYPGWLYSVKQGATTMWERWNSWTRDKGFGPVDMNSFNHYAYGAIGEWMYATVAGIDLDPERPGYKHIIIHPTPGGSLTHASARLLSLYGPIESAWKREGAKFSLDLRIPPNTTATVHLPARSADDVTESGRPAARSEGVAFTTHANGTATYEVPAGEYHFSSVTGD